MVAYYNEFDPFAAQWLRNLIAAGHIASGDVDERSIEDVKPEDLKGYTQCHFFAGIGGWSYALRLAGWPDDRPVWTGSCPCQPFSNAGRRKGTAGESHLWPEFRRLIEECRPSTVFGEQVAAKAGRAWLSTVRAEMEALGYAVGAADLCAAGVGAPHIRQRLWFIAERLANTMPAGRPERWPKPGDGQAPWRSEHDRLADTEREQWERRRASETVFESGNEQRAERLRDAVEVALLDSTGPQQRSEAAEAARYGSTTDTEGGHDRRGPAGPTDGVWRDADWLFCRDGKWRPVEPGASPLAHGIPGRVGRLRGYGNAIVPQVAEEVIGAYMEINND